MNKKQKRIYQPPKIEKMGQLHTLIQGLSGVRSDSPPRPSAPVRP